jgi:hypothetical protein
MTCAIANARCGTFARLIGRLSIEIHELTREIPLREGRLLELEAQALPKEGEMLRVAQEIRMARERLQVAEVDLVELERLLIDCRSKEAEVASGETM